LLQFHQCYHGSATQARLRGLRSIQPSWCSPPTT